jgi:phosphate-selective porin OprO and OprP
VARSNAAWPLGLPSLALGALALLASGPVRADTPMPGFMPRPITPPPAGGVYAHTDDMRFVYRMTGFMHLETRSSFIEEDQVARSDVTFDLRRARAAVEGTMFRILDARLLFDLAMDVVPLDAYVDLRAHRAASLRFGKFKSPFGFERLAPVFAVQFTERAYPTQLAPNRDFGVFLHGQSERRTVGYEIAALGGAEDLEIRNFYAGAPHFAGRIFLMPFHATRLESLRELGLGASTTVGDDADANGLRLRWSVHGHYQLKRLGAWFEFVESSEGVGSHVPGESITNRAWMLQTSLALTEDVNDYFGIKPRHPFAPRLGRFGAFVVAARVHELRMGETSVEGGALVARAGGVALLWKLNHFFESRFDAEYSRRNERRDVAPTTIDEVSLRARLEARF